MGLVLWSALSKTGKAQHTSSEPIDKMMNWLFRKEDNLMMKIIISCCSNWPIDLCLKSWTFQLRPCSVICNFLYHPNLFREIIDGVSVPPRWESSSPNLSSLCDESFTCQRQNGMTKPGINQSTTPLWSHWGEIVCSPRRWKPRGRGWQMLSGAGAEGTAFLFC